MRTWTTRRWAGAALATVVIGLLLGLPTDLVPNPIFGRKIAAPAWAYPAWIVTSVLAGLIVATYVRQDPPTADASTDEDRAVGGDEKRFAAGGLMALFAVGCPTCNALVVLALGSTGAVTFFEPAQPLLAIAGIALLAWALRRRLATADADACAAPTRR